MPCGVCGRHLEAGVEAWVRNDAQGNGEEARCFPECAGKLDETDLTDEELLEIWERAEPAELIVGPEPVELVVGPPSTRMEKVDTFIETIVCRTIGCSSPFSSRWTWKLCTAVAVHGDRRAAKRAERRGC